MDDRRTLMIRIHLKSRNRNPDYEDQIDSMLPMVFAKGAPTLYEGLIT